jgi:hypothetical protein
MRRLAIAATSPLSTIRGAAIGYAEMIGIYPQLFGDGRQRFAGPATQAVTDLLSRKSLSFLERLCGAVSLAEHRFNIFFVNRGDDHG